MDYPVGVTTAVLVVIIAASVYHLARRPASRRPSWPKVKQSEAYTQKATPIKRKIQLPLNSLDDFTPVKGKEAVRDVPAFFTRHGNEFSVYSIDWEQESVVLIRPMDGTDLKRHPFFREAQRRNAAEILVIPFEQLQAVVNVISEKIAHVQEVFVYMTGRCGSTLLTRAVEATSVAQAVSEVDVFDTISLRVIQLRRQCQYLSSKDARSAPVILHNDETTVGLLRNVVALLNFYLVTSDHHHRSVIFYKLRFGTILIGDLMCRAFPAAKTIFMYRHGLDFYESMVRLWFKYSIIHAAFRLFVSLGLWKWAPKVPDYFRIFGDDPKFSAVRYHGSHFYYVVTMWVSTMQHAAELQKIRPRYFFHAVICYTAWVRRKEEMIRLLMEKLEIEWDVENQEEEKRIRTAFVEDSQAGTFLSPRTSAPGEKWMPYTSPPWTGKWEREYISHVCRESGNKILDSGYLFPDTIV